MRPITRPDLEALVAGFAPPPPLRVLELGFGKGQNARIFHARGDAYTGVDRKVEVRGDNLAFGEFLQADYTKALPAGPFDLVFERGSFICNPNKLIRAALKLVQRVLVPGGVFISADLYTEGNPNLKQPWFRSFTLEDVTTLYAGFETVHLAHDDAQCRFDFVGRKRA